MVKFDRKGRDDSQNFVNYFSRKTLTWTIKLCYNFVVAQKGGTVFCDWKRTYSGMITNNTFSFRNTKNEEDIIMPKSLPQRIIFTIFMATVMVYGMIVYNVALATGGVHGNTFLIALHEMPIMVPVAFILEFFIVEKLATALAFRIVRPTDRPIAITLTISTMIILIMCPVMSLIATLLFKEPSFATWVQTWGMNMPMAFIWQLCYCGPFVRFVFGLFAKNRAEAPAAKVATES